VKAVTGQRRHLKKVAMVPEVDVGIARPSPGCACQTLQHRDGRDRRRLAGLSLPNDPRELNEFRLL
jgi:hypothetical protein